MHDLNQPLQSEERLVNENTEQSTEQINLQSEATEHQLTNTDQITTSIMVEPPFQRVSLLLAFVVFFGMANLGIAAFAAEPTIPVFQQIYQLAYFIFRERIVLQVVFYAAVAAHVLEAAWVASVSERKGIRANRWKWIIQTLFVGVGSTILVKSMKDQPVRLSNQSNNQSNDQSNDDRLINRANRRSDGL